MFSGHIGSAHPGDKSSLGHLASKLERGGGVGAIGLHCINVVSVGWVSGQESVDTSPEVGSYSSGVGHMKTTTERGWSKARCSMVFFVLVPL